MQIQDIIHPLDKAAREKLEGIPGFSIAVKSYLKIGLETYLHGINIANKIRLSQTQLPNLYNILPPICETLGIKEPEFYLEMDPYPNAYTSGDTITAITLTSGLVDMLNEDELIAVVAHECGHIACRHVLYGTMAQLLLDGTSKIVNAISRPMQIALAYWMRRSELSCDRVALLISKNPQTIQNLLIRIAGGPSRITKNINVEEYAAQSKEYCSILEESKWNKVLQYYAIMYRPHPFNAVRLNEILEWSKSDQYKNILEGKETKICPKCNSSISDEWSFCKNCGCKLK